MKVYCDRITDVAGGKVYYCNEEAVHVHQQEYWCEEHCPCNGKCRPMTEEDRC